MEGWRRGRREWLERVKRDWFEKRTGRRDWLEGVRRGRRGWFEWLRRMRKDWLEEDDLEKGLIVTEKKGLV